MHEQPGDIVAVSHQSGRREGLVVGSHIDYAVRPISLPFPPHRVRGAAFVGAADVVSVLRAAKSSRSSSTPERSTTRGESVALLRVPLVLTSSPSSVLSHRYPTVTRVRRTVQYLPAAVPRKRTVERHIYW